MLARLALICKGTVNDHGRAGSGPSRTDRQHRGGSAPRTVGSIWRAVDPRSRVTRYCVRRMRVAWFSPLPPVHSGIAAYSVDVLAGCARATPGGPLRRRPGLARGRRASARGCGCPASLRRSGPLGLPLYRAYDFPVQQDRARLRPHRLPARQCGVPPLHVAVPAALAGARRAARRGPASRPGAGAAAPTAAPTTIAPSSGSTTRESTRASPISSSPACRGRPTTSGRCCAW